MIHNLLELFDMLPHREKIKILALQLLVVVGAIFEFIAVISIIPFMSLLGSQNAIEDNSFLMSAYRYFEVATMNEFYLVLAGLSFFALLSSSLVVFWTNYKLARYGLSLSQRLSNQLFSFYLGRNWEEASQTNSSQLTKNISTELGRLTNSIIRPFFHMNGRLVSLGILVTGLIIYEPLATVIMFAIVSCAYLIFYTTFRNILTQNGEIISHNLTARYNTLNQGFGGIKDILMTNTANKFVGDFKRSNDEIFRASLSTYIIGWVPRYLIETAAFGSILGITVWLVWRESGDLSVILPTLSIFALAGLKILPSIQQIYANLTLMKSGLPAFYVIKDDLKRSLHERDTLEMESRFELSGKISANTVNFRYPARKNFKIHDVTLEIPAKHCVGFVGKTGSGKTTLVSLLAGLIVPQSGSIYFDDLKLNENNASSIRRSIGYVSQDAFLLDATIEENIAFGIEKSEIDRDRIFSVVQSAQIADFVKSLDDGLETLIGERGIQISGGQRQRLAIARALYRDARILIFDEATSALDGVTESLIMEAIDSLLGERTLIMIAHRLSTLRNCDRVYVVDEGEVVATGTYDHLLACQGGFSDLRGLG